MSTDERNVRCIWNAPEFHSPSGSHETQRAEFEEEHQRLSGDQLRERYRSGLGTGLSALMVSSIDGSSSLAGVSGGLSSATDQWHMGVVRSAVDAVVVGAGTLQAEGYGPLVVSDEAVRWRRSHGLNDHPMLVVITGSATLDPRSPFLADAPVRPLIITGNSGPESRVAALGRTADVLRLPDPARPQSVSPTAVVNVLHERGLQRLSTEGGPTWLGRVAAAGMLSDVLLTYSPVVAGGTAPRIVGSSAAPVPEGTRDYELRHTLIADSLLLCWYRRS